MTGPEEGFLLLCCALGDTEARPLTGPQFRELGQRVRQCGLDGAPLRELTTRDLTQLGYEEDESLRILRLLDRQPLLDRYLSRAERHSIKAVTRITEGYPQRLLTALGYNAPAALFAIGDLSVLSDPSVAVVGSRVLRPQNEAFAKEMGKNAAEEGLVLVSGNANGADQTAQEACLDAGGACIAFLPDVLMYHKPRERMLYLSADGYDLSFTAQRALYRNRLIHIQGDKTIAIQCTLEKGGTWSGCTDNLEHSWSPLFVYDDGTSAMDALIAHGATGIRCPCPIKDLVPTQISFF